MPRSRASWTDAVPRDAVDGIVWGGTCQCCAQHRARDRADLGLPSRVEGMTVTRACASGLAVTLVAAAIERGEYDQCNRRRFRFHQQW